MFVEDLSYFDFCHFSIWISDVTDFLKSLCWFDKFQDKAILLATWLEWILSWLFRLWCLFLDFWCRLCCLSILNLRSFYNFFFFILDWFWFFNFCSLDFLNFCCFSFFGLCGFNFISFSWSHITIFSFWNFFFWFVFQFLLFFRCLRLNRCSWFNIYLFIIC